MATSDRQGISTTLTDATAIGGLPERYHGFVGTALESWGLVAFARAVAPEV